MNENERQALLQERLGYVNRGLTDRVRQIDALLGGVMGEKEVASGAPPTETATAPKAKRKRVLGDGDN